MARRAHREEAGFAMLVVFLLAAVIGIGLYLEMPRVVMESQRDREELLIDRGTQYQRAIQVFYRKFARYPTDLDALDNTNNIRFLRRRYKDPMTGDDEWRIIHAAGPGIFTDSLVNAPPGAQPAGSAVASTGSAEEAATPIWMQQRPSDKILAGGDSTVLGMPGMEETPPEQPASNSGAPTAGTVVSASAPGSTPEATLAAMQAAQAQAGLDPTLTAAAGGTLPSPVPTGPAPPGTVAAQFGNQPPMPVVPATLAVATGSGGAYPTTVTAAGGSQTTQPANTALQAITQILTSPNTRGLSTAVQTSSAQQPLQAGGIGGVASRLESESIKIYNERSKYNEWEFIYDPRQDRTGGVASMQVPQQNRGTNALGTSGQLTAPPEDFGSRGQQGPGPVYPNSPGGPPIPGGQPVGAGGPPQPPPGRGRGR
jgi:hypothetical protein